MGLRLRLGNQRITPATLLLRHVFTSTTASSPPTLVSSRYLARVVTLPSSIGTTSIGSRRVLNATSYPLQLQFARTFSATSRSENVETTNLNQVHSSSTSSSSSSGAGGPSDSSKSESLSQRLKTLFRTHGWSALTIYLLLSAIDFSLTFLLIYAVGADKVRAAEDYVLDALGWRRKDTGEPGKLKVGFEDWKERHPGAGKVVDGARRKLSHSNHESKVNNGDDLVAQAAGGVDGNGTGAKKGKEVESGYSAIATTAVLAYAIHKTLLLPVRVGITVAITPKVVRTLQTWGWNVGLAKSGATTIRTKKAVEAAGRSP